MENTTQIQTLAKRLSAEKIDKSIINSAKIRSILYEIFVLENGPAHIFIDQYYDSHIDPEEKFEIDPKCRAEWLRIHVKKIEKMVTTLRDIRNKVIHREIINHNILASTCFCILKYDVCNCKFPMTAQRLINDIVNLLDNIFSLMDDCIIGENSAIKNSVNETGLPREIATDLNKYMPSGYVINREKYINSLITFPIPRPDPQIFLTPTTLKSFKLNGWKDALRGHEMIILSGKYEGKICILVSWNGRNVIVQFMNIINKIALPIDVIVDLLDFY